MATKLIKVRFLKHHKNFSYSAGNTGYVNPEWAEKLLKGDDPFYEPFIELIPDDYKEPVPEAVAPSEMVNVRFIRYHRDFAYPVGSIGSVTVENAIKLLEEGFIEVLPEGWKEPIVKTENVPESDFTDVVFLKHHQAYAYKKGDIGKLTPEQANFLQENGFVEIIPKSEGVRKKMLEKLRGLLK